jgi:COP9 signalosome complex subunit 6
MSDHLTRSKYATNRKEDLKSIKVVGALLGRQQGRVMEIVNTVELTLKEPTPGKPVVTESFCRERIEAYKKIWPDLDCIGWYSADCLDHDTPLPIDLSIHQSMQGFTENPIFLLMNPDSKEAREKRVLPFYIYELDSSHQNMVRLEYTLATSDSERIAVDHMVKAIDPNAKVSALSQNILTSVNALKLLRRKIRFLIDIVRNSQEVRQNHDFMRKLN